MDSIERGWSRLRRARGHEVNKNPGWGWVGKKLEVEQLVTPLPIRRICIRCTKAPVEWESETKVCRGCR